MSIQDKSLKRIKCLLNKHNKHLDTCSPRLSHDEFTELYELSIKFKFLTDKKLKEIRNILWPGAYDKYLAIVLKQDELRSLINVIYNDLKPIKNTFDSIAFGGASGSLVGPIICYKLKKNPIYIRYKERHFIPFEGYPTDTCIIIDDFIDSGSTMRKMLKAIRPYCKCKGIYLYNQLYSFLQISNGYNLKNHTFEGIPIIEP